MPPAGQWILPWHMNARKCNRHPDDQPQPCARCTANWSSIDSWFSDRGVNTRLRELYWTKDKNYVNIEVPPWDAEEVARSGEEVYNPFTGQRIVPDLRGSGGSSGLAGEPASVSAAGKRTASGTQSLVAPTGSSVVQAGSSKSPSKGPILPPAADTPGKPSSSKTSEDHFVPSPFELHKVEIRRGDIGDFEQKEFNNVTAQNILDAYSKSPGRRIVRVEKKMRDYPARDVPIVGDDLKKNISQLSADAELKDGHLLVFKIYD